MRKQSRPGSAAEGAGRATGAAAELERKGRFSARRKHEAVLRLLRGEDLESVSRELGITAARASQWREQFLVAGQAGLRSRASEALDDDQRGAWRYCAASYGAIPGVSITRSSSSATWWRPALPLPLPRRRARGHPATGSSSIFK